MEPNAFAPEFLDQLAERRAGDLPRSFDLWPLAGGRSRPWTLGRCPRRRLLYEAHAEGFPVIALGEGSKPEIVLGESEGEHSLGRHNLGRLQQAHLGEKIVEVGPQVLLAHGAPPHRSLGLMVDAAHVGSSVAGRTLTRPGTAVTKPPAPSSAL